MADYWLPKDEMLPQIATKTYPGKYAHQYIHVREVVPDTVTITREQLEDAFEKASKREWSHDYVQFDVLERELFDPQTPRNEGGK